MTNKPGKAFYNARRWAILQHQKVMSAAMVDSTAKLQEQEATRLVELRALAKALEPLPHMANMLADVNATIARLERK